MNWNHFILLLIGIYLAYYAINILADLYLQKKAPGIEDEQEVLFFSEDIQPDIIIYDDELEPSPTQVVPEPQTAEVPTSYPVSALDATGAVSLKELIRAAQSGLIQYTKAIPY